MLFLMYLQLLHAGHSVAWNDCGGEEFNVKLYRKCVFILFTGRVFILPWGLTRSKLHMLELSCY